jgi:hypothetical protein
VTLGTVRPLLIQAHNLLFFEYPWPLTTIEATTSPKFNKWLAENTLQVTTIMHLWFLSYTVICVALYPIIAKVVQIIERIFGTLGLMLSVLVWSSIAIIPMIIDRSEVNLILGGAAYFDALTYFWTNPYQIKKALRLPKTTPSIWTDEPTNYDHFFVPDGALWSSNPDIPKVGNRDYIVAYVEGPHYKLPWFLSESSVTWPIAFILYFASGVATVAIMIRIEEWSKTSDKEEDNELAEQEKARAARKARRAANERTPLTSSEQEADDTFDIESGSTEAPLHTKSYVARLTSRLRATSIWLRRSCTTHEARGHLADLCVLVIVIPSFVQPMDYKRYRDNYFPRNNGFGDISNWAKAYTPVFCLFLYGSASQGGAGYFAALFSSDSLVALGEISLAVYALQTTLARACAVRFFLRGPTAENYCNDLEDYFVDMPGKLTREVNQSDPTLRTEEKAHLSNSHHECLDVTGDLVTLYIVVLLIVASIVTYEIEPLLDEKFRSAIGYLRNLSAADFWAYLHKVRDQCAACFKAVCTFLGCPLDEYSAVENEEETSDEFDVRQRAESLRRGMLGWIRKRRESREHRDEVLSGEGTSLLAPSAGKTRETMRF